MLLVILLQISLIALQLLLSRLTFFLLTHMQRCTSLYWIVIAIEFFMIAGSALYFDFKDERDLSVPAQALLVSSMASRTFAALLGE